MKKPSLILSAAIILTMFAGCSTQKENASNNISETEKESQTTKSSVSDNRFADYDFSNVPENIQLNENPDVSKKELPEPYLMADYIEPENISDTVRSNSKIIIGKPIETFDYYFSLTGSDEGDSKADELTGGHGSQKGIVTTVEVLYSPNNDFAVGDTVRIFSPTEHWGQNLETGKEYLLTFVEWENIYKYSWGMDNIYDISSDFCVTCRSPFVGSSQLDTLSLAEAVTVLENAIEDKQALE